MSDLSTNNNVSGILEILKYVISFFFGGIAFFLKEKYQNRKSILTKRVWGQRLGFSVQSQDWGDIQILYNGQESNNLHVISAEINNTSNKDFPNLIFEFSVPIGCTIYRHFGQLHYDDVVKDLSLQKEFNQIFEDVRNRNAERLQNQQELDPILDKDISFVTRHRRFLIPLIKCKTKAIFHFLVEDEEDNPYLNISILEPNLRLVAQQDENDRMKTQKKITEYGGMILFLIISIPIYLYSTTVGMVTILMIINLFSASVISLGFYNFYNWIKKIITE